MQANSMPGDPPGELGAQRAILALAMEIYPLYRTIPELGRVFGSTAVVRRAAASLVSYGLIVLHGNTLMPTQAAYHCHRLDAW